MTRKIVYNLWVKTGMMPLSDFGLTTQCRLDSWNKKYNLNVTKSDIKSWINWNNSLDF